MSHHPHKPLSQTSPSKHWSTAVLLVAACMTSFSLSAQSGAQEAQEIVQDNFINFGESDNDAFVSFRISPSTSLNDSTPLISIARSVESKDVDGHVVESALNFNLGVELTPIDGLNVRADAWGQQIEESPALVANGNWQGQGTELFLEDSTINEFNLDNPLLGTEVKTSGFDFGASYVWDANRFGQFTLSTKTTYVQEFENNGSLLELANAEFANIEDRVISPELQSSLMLTWQFGNHTASAITNYFNSFKDLSELDMEELNTLVDNITTFDLQYGYSVKTGDKDRAIITFGIRNIFNEKTAQILNSSTRVLDQNGRVAYGSIKYQF